MVIGLFHPGSGLGDQLFCYLAARITAERLNVPFGMVGDFKGKDFLHLNTGAAVDQSFHVEMPAGKIIVDSLFPVYEGKRWYDPEFNFVEDNTIIDGCMMQDWRYFEHDWYSIRNWLTAGSKWMPEDVCVIGYRGGEYSVIPELYLQLEYWQKAIKEIKDINPNIKFEVHTDDPGRAKEMLRELLPSETPYIHDIALNWKSVRYARYLIIANSAFYIIPALLNQQLKHNVIAPRFWARRNIKEWSLPQNYYRQFQYV